MSRSEKNTILKLRVAGISYGRVALTLSMSVNTVKSCCKCNPIPSELEFVSKMVFRADCCLQCNAVLEQFHVRIEAFLLSKVLDSKFLSRNWIIIGLFQLEIASIPVCSFTFDLGGCNYLAQRTFNDADTQCEAEFPYALLGKSSEFF